MAEQPDHPEQTPLPETVTCSVCRREIPRIDALKEEGDEYIRWFCGFDCYQRAHQDNTNGQH